MLSGKEQDYCIFGDGQLVTHWAHRPEPPRPEIAGVCFEHAEQRRGQGYVVTPGNVTILAGGGTVYVYADDDPNISDMYAVLVAACPGDDIAWRTVTTEQWAEALPQLNADGLKIVDTRVED